MSGSWKCQDKVRRIHEVLLDRMRDNVACSVCPLSARMWEPLAIARSFRDACPLLPASPTHKLRLASTRALVAVARTALRGPPTHAIPGNAGGEPKAAPRRNSTV
jgi:hypothetical protein